MDRNPRPGTLILVIDMLFASDEVDRAVDLLLSGAGRTEAMPHCRFCGVTRDAAGEGRVRYSEEWESEPALSRHLRSDEFRRVLVAMEMGASEPQVRIGSLSGRDGLAYLKRIRGSAASSEGKRGGTPARATGGDR